MRCTCMCCSIDPGCVLQRHLCNCSSCTAADIGVSAQLLGGQTKPGGGSIINSYQVKDGVLAFEDADDAERFAQQLEADGQGQVRSQLQYLSNPGASPQAQLIAMAH